MLSLVCPQKEKRMLSLVRLPIIYFGFSNALSFDVAASVSKESHNWDNFRGQSAYNVS